MKEYKVTYYNHRDSINWMYVEAESKADAAIKASQHEEVKDIISVEQEPNR